MADNSRVRNKRRHLTNEERLPRCYKDVSKVLKTVKACKSNLKTVLSNSRQSSNSKKLAALAHKILQSYQIVTKVIEVVGLLEKEPRLDKECAEVMVYELILGKGTLPGSSKPVMAVQTYRDDILKAFKKFKSTVNSDLCSLPRYARVNFVVTDVETTLEELSQLGFKQVEYGDGISQEEYLELVRSLRSPQFLVDYHFPDLLVFASKENLCDLTMYCKGVLLLQDKSSCFPVRALNPEPGSVVLDACAAPGMKTVHIANLMQRRGVLHAYEKDAKRFATLQKVIKTCKVDKICKTYHQDFSTADPKDEPHCYAKYILVDPSCSGSGMVDRMDAATDKPDSKGKERLEKLAMFQIAMLKHALKFPCVLRVVYSTCSIYEEENEFVVHEALRHFGDRFRLIPVMSEWPTRGSDRYEFGKFCLRCSPHENLTNGFFVAAFERIAFQ